MREFKTLDAFIDEIDKLKQAHKIVEQIWLEFGPYDDRLPHELKEMIRNYFRFDDSE